MSEGTEAARVNAESHEVSDARTEKPASERTGRGRLSAGHRMDHPSLQQTFTAALERLVDQIKQDRSILAVFLCGSLSHDRVWEGSDIDLALVAVDDKKIESSSIALYADGINVHAFLIPRAQFRQTVAGSLQNSFIHSLLATGRLLYTHDETIADLAAALGTLGTRDTRIQLLRAATGALVCLYKARKWFVTRADLDYTALWILYAATPLAQIEVIAAGHLAGREVILQAMAINPSFFRTVYVDLLNGSTSSRRVERALTAAEEYVAERTTRLFAPLLDYLRETGDPRSASELQAYFQRNLGVSDALTACEYLSDRGIIAKVSTSVHLTKKSNVDVQELAFFSLEEPGR